MKSKVLILILPSFFKFLIFPSITLIQHIWTFFIKVFSETTWSRIMKSLTILSFHWKCFNLWWLPLGVCELCSLLAIFIMLAQYTRYRASHFLAQPPVRTKTCSSSLFQCAPTDLTPTLQLCHTWGEMIIMLAQYTRYRASHFLAQPPVRTKIYFIIIVSVCSNRFDTYAPTLSYLGWDDYNASSVYQIQS